MSPSTSKAISSEPQSLIACESLMLCEEGERGLIPVVCYFLQNTFKGPVYPSTSGTVRLPVGIRITL